ncbi:unnamed protein product [Ectocarpus fasciculatus]
MAGGARFVGGCLSLFSLRCVFARRVVFLVLDRCKGLLVPLPQSRSRRCLASCHNVVAVSVLPVSAKEPCLYYHWRHRRYSFAGVDRFLVFSLVLCRSFSQRTS